MEFELLDKDNEIAELKGQFEGLEGQIEQLQAEAAL